MPKLTSGYTTVHFAFIDLEKAFNRVPHKVLWWAICVVCVPERTVVIAQEIYNGAKSKVRVNGSYSDEFERKVGLHQSSVLSPLFFITVLEALSRELHTSCPCKLLDADDLVLIAETLDLLMEKLKLWKDNMETKGFFLIGIYSMQG